MLGGEKSAVVSSPLRANNQGLDSKPWPQRPLCGQLSSLPLPLSGESPVLWHGSPFRSRLSPACTCPSAPQWSLCVRWVLGSITLLRALSSIPPGAPRPLMGFPSDECYCGSCSVSRPVGVDVGTARICCECMLSLPSQPAVGGSTNSLGQVPYGH